MADGPAPGAAPGVAPAAHDVLVVDTSALIRGAPLDRLARELFTVGGVLAEVRDRQTRANLAAPRMRDMVVREPSDEALGAVTAFARKTGDLGALSTVDLRVLALTWMLEKQFNGVAHLRTEPLYRLERAPRAAMSAATLPGFHRGRARGATGAEAPAPTASSRATDADHDEALARLSDTSARGCCIPDGASTGMAVDRSCDVERGKCTSDVCSAPDVRPGDTTKAPGADAAVGEGGDANNHDISIGSSADDDGDDIVDDNDDDDEHNSSQGSIGHHDDSGNDDVDRSGGDHGTDSSSDDDSDWITPTNIAQIKAMDSAAVETEQSDPRPVRLGCITADFAMQNVLLQMGLCVVSMDGLRIHRTRQYAQRCHACFQYVRRGRRARRPAPAVADRLAPYGCTHRIMYDTERAFCHSCGNRALLKISIEVDGSGNITYFSPRRRRQMNLRGTRVRVAGVGASTGPRQRSGGRFMATARTVLAAHAAWRTQLEGSDPARGPAADAPMSRQEARPRRCLRPELRGAGVAVCVPRCPASVTQRQSRRLWQ